MDTALVEEIKNLLKDVENFLTQTIKNSSLNKDNVSKKSQLVNSVQNVIQKLEGEEVQEMYDDVDIQKIEPIPDDCDELYEITEPVAATDDNVSKKSQEGKLEEADDPYGYGGSGTKIGQIAAEKLINPTFSGNLEKKSKNLIGKTWQTRYCVIKDNAFYYYKKKTNSEQQGDIVLNGYEARACPHLDNPKKNERNFELVCPTKRSYQFIASDSTVMNSWIEAVAKASVTPFPTNTASPPSQQEDFDGLYEDTAIAEETYDDTAIDNQASEDFDDVYELVESDYADARRKQEEAAHSGPPTAAPIAAKPLPAKPLPPKPVVTENADDFGGLYDDVDIQPSSPAIPKKDASKPLPKLPPQPPSPAQKKPQIGVPAIPSRSPVSADSSGVQPKNVPSPTSSLPSEQTNGDVTSEPWDEDYRNIYMTKWDCEGSGSDELSLKRGDLVHILSREYDSYGWWIGEKNLTVGLVPLDYLMKAYKI
ncbi:src kinase-associated phosphoprotein 2-like [Antedon mediterranea]|uniref:src kinase-associated phosphoprotein 2-like n=1 Tax=Antedon mediterranea TaxID=105859 RepID=UPI003AF5698C